MASASAKPTVVLCFWGLNTTDPTSTAWNRPSPSWVVSRSPSRYRKSRDDRTSLTRERVVRFTPSGYGGTSVLSAGRGEGGVASDGLDVEEGRPVGGLGLAVPDDELLDHLPGHLVGELHRRRLHEVRRRPDERTGHAAIHGEPRAADGVDGDPGGVRAVPHLKLQLEVERHVAERPGLQADRGPLAALEPRP